MLEASSWPVCVVYGAMGTSNVRSLFPSLPYKPHHLGRGFSLPKKSFGKAKPISCSAQNQWFDSLPFLHYDVSQDVQTVKPSRFRRDCPDFYASVPICEH